MKRTTSLHSRPYANRWVSHWQADFLVWENKIWVASKDLAPLAKPPDTDGSFRHDAAWFEHLRMEVVQTTAVRENNYRPPENFREGVFTIACTVFKVSAYFWCLCYDWRSWRGRGEATKLPRWVLNQGGGTLRWEGSSNQHQLTQQFWCAFGN